MTKLVVVVGITGGQGRSVMKALLSNPSYKLRGTTRDTTSENAKALAAKGVEVVPADFNDEESLVRAFQGANVIFAFTNFFETFLTLGPDESLKIEYAQGVNLAKAASKTPTLEHYIWSTLADSKALSGGAIEVPHFQGKSEVDKYIKQDPILLKKTTFLWCSCFQATFAQPPLVPNFLKYAGKYVQLSPAPASTPIACLGDHEHNIGIFVEAILAKPHLTLPGKYVLASTESKTMGEMLEKWSEVTGKPVEYVQISLEAYDALWPKWGRELGLNLKMWSEYSPSWGPDDFIGKEELGIGERLIGVEQALRETDWSGLL